MLAAKHRADAESVCARSSRPCSATLGRRAETLDPDQLALGLEDVEKEIADGEVGTEATAPAAETERAATRRTNRGALPAHLPRIETVVDIADKTCPGSRGVLHRIGEDVAERLDIVRVLVLRRPRYACRACEEAVVQAPAPWLIKGGLPTEAADITGRIVQDHPNSRLDKLLPWA